MESFSGSARERDEFDKLLVRTHFGDDTAWQAVLAESLKPWGDEEDDEDFQSTTFAVDDPRLRGMSADDVREALSASDEHAPVVFIADEETMRSPHLPLLALNLVADDQDDEPSHHSDAIRRQCRIVPREASGLHCNVVLGNMDFEDWSATAHSSPDGIFHSFP